MLFTINQVVVPITPPRLTSTVQCINTLNCNVKVQKCQQGLSYMCTFETIHVGHSVLGTKTHLYSNAMH